MRFLARRREERKEELERKLNSLYERVISYVRDEILKPYAKQVGDNIGSLDSRLTISSGKRKSEIKGLNKTVEGLQSQLADYEARLSQVELSQQKSGIVYEAIKPKGGVTFDDVKAFATEVSDKAYQRIRDYFLLEMANKGYEEERPNFFILDKDSNIELRFFYKTEVRDYKLNNRISDMPPFELRTDQRYPVYNPDRKILVPKDFVGNLDQVVLLDVIDKQLYSTFHGVSEWEKMLSEELPQMLQAYMIGYSLRCLDNRKDDDTLEVQKKHGLKDNPALLERMAEIMQKDANLANKFLTHYKS